MTSLTNEQLSRVPGRRRALGRKSVSWIDPVNVKVLGTVDWRAQGAVTPVKDQGTGLIDNKHSIRNYPFLERFTRQDHAVHVGPFQQPVPWRDSISAKRASWCLFQNRICSTAQLLTATLVAKEVITLPPSDISTITASTRKKATRTQRRRGHVLTIRTLWEPRLQATSAFQAAMRMRS